jgi:hypothetical protein
MANSAAAAGVEFQIWRRDNPRPLVAGVAVNLCGSNIFGQACRGESFTAVLVALSPALLIGTTFNLLTAIIITASRSGQRIHPVDFIAHMLVGWLLIPAAAGLLGALPFLRGQSLGS